MSNISTHVLDTSLGKPAKGIKVEIFRSSRAGWHSLGVHTTDGDGRIAWMRV